MLSYSSIGKLQYKFSIDIFRQNERYADKFQSVQEQFYNIIGKMEGDLSPQRFELVLKLCDILAIEDFTVATLILKQCNWNLQKALGMEDAAFAQPNPKPQNNPQQPQPAPQKSEAQPPPQPQLKPEPKPEQKKQEKPQQPKVVQIEPNQQQQIENNQYYYNQQQEIPYDYNLDEYYQQEEEEEYYRKQQQKHQEIENKKRIFNTGFTSMPLVKTKSQVMDFSEKRLFLDKEICQNYSKHRFDYQNNLLEKSALLCQRILSSKSSEMRRIYDSIKKNQNNKQFLSYLHKKYSSKINFTFGTFLLNLARSHLDNKYLLVYIHKSQFQDSQAVKTLLGQKQISNFVNKHCVSYGMFDSSDDYEMLQKYVLLKDVPNFALFKFNQKDMKEDFINSYPVLLSEPHSFLQWLSSNIGVVLKPKQNIPKPIKEDSQQLAKRYEMSNIIYSQNQQYEEMARLYQLKRQKSKARKVSIELFDQQIQKLKQKFKEEPTFETGVTIQIRFRLPVSGNSLLRNFKLTDKVSQMFQYIHCFGREQFEQRLAQFDLTQTFPKLSLNEKKQLTILQVFTDSERENLIVKQL